MLRAMAPVRIIPPERVPPILERWPALRLHPRRRQLARWLRAEGVRGRARAIEIEWRERCWMAMLPEHVLLGSRLWDPMASHLLLVETLCMNIAREVCGEFVPKTVFVKDAPCVLLRERKRGLQGHAIEASIFGVEASALASVPRLTPDCPLTPFGERFASELGRAIARLHAHVPASFGRAVNLSEKTYQWERVGRALHERVDDPSLTRALGRARAWRAGLGGERVVIHGDLHLLNMFAGPDGTLVGLIDFEDCALESRYEDLRYLHSQGPGFARAAVSAYEREAGVAIDMRTVGRLHVVSALEHFAWVDPDGPRFPRIVRWAREALAALAPEWIAD